VDVRTLEVAGGQVAARAAPRGAEGRRARRRGLDVVVVPDLLQTLGVREGREPDLADLDGGAARVDGVDGAALVDRVGDVRAGVEDRDVDRAAGVVAEDRAVGCDQVAGGVAGELTGP